MTTIQQNVLNFCKANGFSSTGETYMILLEDTYSIKDELKAAGCKYNQLLGWHSPVELENYPTHFFLLAELYHIEKATGNIVQKTTAEAEVQKVRNEAFPPHPSKSYDSDTLEAHEVTLVETGGFNGRYGWTNIYTFMDEDEHFFVYFTTRSIPVEMDDVILIDAVVKDRKEYKGIQQTIIKNVKYKKILEA